MPARIIEPDSEVAAFRLPTELRARAKQKARAEDLTFSQLVRRALRREIVAAGIPIGNGK